MRPRPIVLLDEVTAKIDAVNERQIMCYLVHETRSRS